MPEPVPLTDDDPAAIGGYRLLGRLGKGGQGTVYLAEPTQGEPRVAIKRLGAEALDDPRVRQRFVREAEAARQVASFCTAAVLGADFDADSPYIVSEYVEGRSLSQRVRQDGPLVGGDLNRLAVATATALVAIHEAGIVHRDFKPGNIMLSDGGARVIDFGIAQITEGSGTLTNSSIGTPAFMAPEQIAHGSATPASDVFAWGAVLVYAATGASPFDGSTVANALHNVLHAEPDLSALPDVLRPLAAAALAKDPAARPAAVDVLMGLLGRQQRPVDAADLTQAMDEARTAVLDDGTTVTARPPTQTAAPPRKHPARRRRQTDGRHAGSWASAPWRPPSPLWALACCWATPWGRTAPRAAATQVGTPQKTAPRAAARTRASSSPRPRPGRGKASPTPATASKCVPKPRSRLPPSNPSMTRAARPRSSCSQKPSPASTGRTSRSKAWSPATAWTRSPGPSTARLSCTSRRTP